MGMFDRVRCEYPLPVKGAPEFEYQTKDTPTQFLDEYLIGEDGHLYHEAYDIEDHSDPNATDPIDRLVGCMARVNKRWEKLDGFTGEIRFYGDDEQDKWWEFSVYFVNGAVREINVIEAPGD